MHDFGKLTGKKETYERKDAQGQSFDPPQTVDYIAFYDAAGVEWHKVFGAAPYFDFYIALDENDRVISMEVDPEQSQIGDCRILGISNVEASGFTRGVGGSAYGKLWNGTSIVVPPAAVVTEVSARQFKLQLFASGILDQVDQWIATQSKAVQIAYEYSGSFVRSEPMMAAGFAAMGFTDQQIDNFFTAAAAL